MFSSASRHERLVAQYLRRLARELNYMPFSVFDGKRLRIDDVMFILLYHYVRGRHKVIVDPTCGVENRSFSRLFPVLEAWEIEYRGCDLNPANPCNAVCNVFRPDTLPSGSFWFYDPPYLPHARGDERASTYGIDASRHITDIRKYYTARVLEGFIARGAEEILVKGADFYYPQSSDRLYVFVRDILEPPPISQDKSNTHIPILQP